MKSHCLWVGLVFSAANLSAQSSPNLQFSGHTLGESAETFFSAAQMADSKSMTRDYCKALLDDPRTKEKVDAAKDSMSRQGALVLKKGDFSLLDVSNCRQAIAALQGDNAHVGARLASELGKGSAYFTSGKLAALNLFLDTPYSEVVADMEKRFGVRGEKHAVAHPGWPTVKEEMRWEANGVSASVLKNPLSEGAIIFVGYLRPPYDSLLRGAAATESPATSAALPETPRRAEVPTGVMSGLLIHRVRPLYPTSAKENHIQGTVILQAVIGIDGQIAELTPLSGPAELTQVAVDAVKQWQYRPYILSGKPAEAVTRITVNFKLSP
ncbi:MAG: energy transducer TonB [Terriglobales bacterium]